MYYGPEFMALHFNRWAKQRGITLLFIQPGKPAQNAYIERFNRSYRESVLDMYCFENLGDVRELTGAWVEHYNHERPHQALGMQPPMPKVNTDVYKNSLSFKTGVNLGA